MMKLICTSFLLCICLSVYTQTENKKEESSDRYTSVENNKTSFESRMTSGDYGHLTLTAMPGQQMMNPTVASQLSKKRFTYNEIDGSPYLNTDYVKGIVIMNNGKEIVQVPLRVDLYTQSIIATTDEGKEIALNPEVYKTVEMPFDNDILILQKAHPDKADTFFAILYEDKELIFFREDYVTFREPTNNGISNTDARFTQRKNYYLHYKSKEKPTKVKLKKKNILESLPENKSTALLKYANKKKNKLKTESDFINAFLGTKLNYLKS